MSNEIYWNPLVPEITVMNLAKSLEFYKIIGFSVRFERDLPAFAYIELGQAQLMLEEEHDSDWNVLPLDRPLGRGINFQIEVPDIKSLVNAFHKMNIPLFREAKETWYPVSSLLEEGQLEFLVQDPDGYLLRFAQYLGSRPCDQIS
jgi:catechol 2,3-dioxygenase-like lactoylglutathione lyase family enzyme